MAIEFRVEGFTYQSRQMDAFTQLDIVSLMSPMVTAGAAQIIPLFRKLRDEGMNNVGDVPLIEMLVMAGPVARELARMPLSDRRYIIGICLGLCDRKRDGEQFFAPIWNQQSGTAMFDDINNDMTVMLRIAAHVFEATFTRFFPVSASNTSDTKESSSTPSG